MIGYIAGPLIARALDVAEATPLADAPTLVRLLPSSGVVARGVSNATPTATAAGTTTPKQTFPVVGGRVASSAPPASHTAIYVVGGCVALLAIAIVAAKA